MSKHTIVPAVALILECDDKIFAGRRQNTGYCDGLLNLPAGHIDPDETPREALIRECREEIGLEISPTKLEFVHIQYNRNEGAPFDRTHYYFRLKNCDVLPMNTEPEKCSEIMWLKIEDRIDEFVPFMKAALIEIQKGALFSEFFDSTSK